MRGLFRAMVENDEVPPSMFPAPLKAFLHDAALPFRVDPAILARGQRVFADHGPEILLTLGCYSLPAAYAANDGVRVLAQTDYLESHPARRLAETAQMIVDVMRPGGLDPDGRGVRSARKVRLMHAAIRRLILAREAPAWDTAALGVPINQEDLAGTLMTFAFVPLDGLRQLGVRLAAEDRDAWIRTWGAVGALMGIEDDLIPRTFEEADWLTRAIHATQIRTDEPNPDGQRMTRALVDMFDEHLPGRLLDFAPPSLMRLFLPRDVSDALAVPRHWLGDAWVRATAKGVGVLDRLALGGPLRRWAFRRISRSMIQMAIDVGRGGKRTRFDLPLSLRGPWQLN